MTTTLHWHPASEPPEHNRRVLVLWWSHITGYCYGIITRRANSWGYVIFWAELPDPELFGNSEELEAARKLEEPTSGRSVHDRDNTTHSKGEEPNQ